MKLLSDRIQEFINWLEKNTDFCVWHPEVKKEVHKQLIIFMISDKIEEENKGCKLNLDSPSYPPEEDEYRQCGCPSCFQYLKKLEDAKELLADLREERDDSN